MTISATSWGRAILLGFVLQAGCCVRPEESREAPEPSKEPAPTPQNSDPNRKYEIKGPRDSPEPGRFVGVEWELEAFRISAKMREPDAGTWSHRVWERVVEQSEAVLTRCAASETALWWAAFSVRFQGDGDNKAESVLETHHVQTRSGPAAADEPQAVRLTACVRAVLSQALSRMRPEAGEPFSVRLSFSWRNPDRYVFLGDLSRFNGMSRIDSVALDRNYLCVKSLKGAVSCRSRDGEIQLPRKIRRIRGLSLFGDRLCGIGRDGQMRCIALGGMNPNVAAPGGTFAGGAVGGSFACGLTENGRLSCRSFETGRTRIIRHARFAQVSCGQGYVCAVQSDGEIWCSSLLRLRKRTHDLTWPLDWKDVRYTQVSVGGNFVCALTDTGKIECHVYARDRTGNAHGRIDAPAGRFTQLSAGLSHACALDIHGRIVCWGDNRAGQTEAPGGSYKTVAAGAFISCGINEEDSLACWGNNRLPEGRWE